ncbi:MAG: Peptidyl-prolyl cis-trans isomerase [Candidatus Woesebacteria bacterium GW2011_GWA1_37_8]|uniref:Peptidyl-prolyl cis-trans isomerase n=2 Tax=Candidatus Woeseibacteriota TaxID=1752722 RepID=A0A0G0PEC9_9BACT|nr:MAG: Peptidyl-prolyl cis-trans isomerase [Microgenomates group bacterium GW2011_GWC1_37_12b]KKQ46195.1 MAG: Peptidyl-prolyl cis-trans isomerase [Candidatus Woesebacteria bacterium GW2011_GWA1_37_8]KKQ87606.1 MAG: Peptidyl-prolyl cis-trans isomerase [Candidatus Woesebacteria bacterium GW2011_GWB1_38_8b]
MEDYKIGFNWKNIGQISLFLILAGSVIIGVSLLDKVIYKKNGEAKPEVNVVQNMDTVTELKIEDLKIGTGLDVKNGNTVTVNYKGTLIDGKQFDSSYDSGQPFSFKVGEGKVIKGWDQGLLGMKVGGMRKLTIPSSLGYGEQGAGADIPPNATLIFEIELLKVE